jgi:osmotically-inducible protein OsmY
MKTTLMTTALVAIFAAALMGGCSQEAKEDYSQAGDNLGQAAEKIGEGAKKDASQAAATAEDTTMTGKVKGALMSADGVDSKGIDVDTRDKVVHLKGTVPTEDQKAKAEQIATNQVGTDFTVSNELTVAAPGTEPNSQDKS